MQCSPFGLQFLCEMVLIIDMHFDFLTKDIFVQASALPQCQTFIPLPLIKGSVSHTVKYETHTETG